MTRIAIILLIIFAVGCGPVNDNFNPFDNEFKFHKNIILSDYDTIMGECGYWNYTNRVTGSYYQFFLDEGEIVAKGFNVTLSPILLQDSINQADPNHVVRLLQKYPVRLEEVEEKLQTYNSKLVRLTDNRDGIPGVEIIEENGSIQHATLSPYLENNKLIWEIQFFNGKDHK